MFLFTSHAAALLLWSLSILSDGIITWKFNSLLLKLYPATKHLGIACISHWIRKEGVRLQFFHYLAINTLYVYLYKLQHNQVRLA